MPTDIAAYLRAALGIEDERGASVVEYALLLALILAVCIIAVETLGTKTEAKFTGIGSSLG